MTPKPWIKRASCIGVAAALSAFLVALPSFADPDTYQAIVDKSSEGNVDTYTVTLRDGGTFSFNVTNGVDGVNGRDGVDGTDGAAGRDGVDGADGE